MTTSPLKPVAAPVDPFDVEALKAAPPTVSAAEHVLVSVAARRPNRQEFFRVHPDPAYRVDATVLEYEGVDGRQIYFIPPAMRSYVPEEAKAVRIFTCVSKQGVLFLWPAKLPSADGMGRSWHESALAIAEKAEGQWVKMVGNRLAGAYEAFVANGDLGLPQWPTEPLGDLLRKAFSGERLIDSPDHDVLRALRGEL